MKNIFIDTDPGVDDFLAILLLILSQKTINIKAITTVMGNSSINNVTNNAKYILDLTNRQDIPLYKGSSKPLKNSPVLGQVMGSTGLNGVTVPKLKNYNTLKLSTLKSLIMKSENKPSILVLGPQTNIAKLLARYPEIEKMIDSLIIMGGAFDVPGNKNRVAEFNYFVDPDAAKIVMQSNIQKIIIPLDLCYQVPLYLKDFRIINTSLYYPILVKIMKPYIKALAKYEDQQGAIVYDALAAYYLINPEAFTLTPMDVVVETKGEYTKGMTVANKSSTARPNIQVAIALDQKAFKEDIFRILNEENK